MSRRILIVSMSGSFGHVSPMLGVAENLRRNGHEVAWLSLPEALGSYAEAVRSVGARVLPTPVVPKPAPSSSTTATGALTGSVEAAAAFVRSTYIDSVPGYLPAVRQLIREFAPDVAAVDSMSFSGVIAASQENVPYASMCMGLQMVCPEGFESPHAQLWRALSPARSTLFAEQGVACEFKLNACLSPALNVVFATEALVGARFDAPANTVLVGPSIPGAGRLAPEFPWHRVRGDRPLVYISMGTMLSDPSLYEITAAAAASLGAQPIISAARVDASSLVLPEDTIFVAEAPQHALLERVQVFVSHGGANSVAEAMYCGVPVLVIPLGIDQPLQAHFVSAAGAGLAVPRDQLSLDTCRGALEKLLGPSSEQLAGAARIRDAYRTTDGAARAAEHLLRIARAT